VRALAPCSCQSLPWRKQGGRLLVAACADVIQFRYAAPRALFVRSRESGNPGISVACPPVHARGRLWVPASAGTTDCLFVGFPDSLLRGDDERSGVTYANFRNEVLG
jgi:hypothetical protein